jgi:hypothetical protein
MESTEVWSASRQFSSTQITNQYDQLFIIFRTNILLFAKFRQQTVTQGTHLRRIADSMNHTVNDMQ